MLKLVLWKVEYFGLDGKIDIVEGLGRESWVNYSILGVNRVLVLGVWWVKDE